MIELASREIALYYAVRSPDLRQRGRRWRGACPVHKGTHQNFSVDPETGLWRCWSCGRYGDVIALEIALTGGIWREAVAAVEQIIGRVLLDRLSTRTQRRALAERREREQREIRAAEFFRIAAESMAEYVLEELPEAVPERRTPTQLLLSLRAARQHSVKELLHGLAVNFPEISC